MVGALTALGAGIGGYVLGRLERIRFYGRKLYAGRTGRNISSLYVLQSSGYLLSLILVPYLVRVLGAAGYGVIAFCQGLMAYAAVLVSYGFDWSGTREVAARRDDPEHVSKVVSSIVACKLILAVISGTVLFGVVVIVPSLHAQWRLFGILYVGVAAGALFPSYLFQGLERIAWMAAISLCSRVLMVAGIFLLVTRPEHFVRYAAFITAQSVTLAIIGLVVAVVRLQFRPNMPSIEDVRMRFREGWVLFLSSAATSLITAGNSFLLGLFADFSAVGVYAAAERIMQVASGFLGPIGQTFYPRSSYLAKTSRSLLQANAIRLFKIMALIGGGFAVVLLVSAGPVVDVVLGSGFARSAPVLRILACFVLVNAITNVLGVQLLLPLGYDRIFLLILAVSGVANLVLAAVLIPRFQEKGMAAAVMASGALVLALQGGVVLRRNLLGLARAS
ncbi:MAG: flippase [Planctomycetota bacterium]